MYRKQVTGYALDHTGTLREQVTYYYGMWHIPIKTTNVKCSDGRLRVAYYVGEPDTYFSQPARMQVKGKTVAGSLYCDEDSMGHYLSFSAYQYRKNHDVLPQWDRAQSQ